MLTATEILLAARAKIEKGWTQGAYARDRHGEKVGPLDTKAVCWCVEGVFFAIGVTPSSAGDYFSTAIGTEDYPCWNDQLSRTQAEVLAAFDRAVALSSKE